ncbi:DUF4956 domain-containing protein [Metasolibacillus sp.]|uniref:DUF4956 domain-containing protein n=1 Tax=Metasolibacillus sp. TaxID=2703680 RepID=UPI0025E8AC8A|nr:DUF4956 domain-containing protein [Metasolibacillus sp.]MCT6925795.1 DUF4956 domain-containing protein [Metasolibacillus sp.]MCT6941903.1 DUF4956 domain-containing protein [Metasolibacillus sp.]
MDTTNFTDIFKSSFLEKTTSFSLTDSLIGLVVAFFVGLFIYAVYKKTFNGIIYSHSFNISLLIMTMATALVIMGISSNVLLSLGMVGALSIVRFRTPIKDPMDLVYIFWAIVSGILCGAGFIPLVIVGAILIGLVLVVFVNKMTIENPYLLVVKFEQAAVNEELEQLMAKYSKKYALKSKSIMQGSDIEATYEVRMKSGDAQLMEAVAQLNGVKSAIMLSYDGNFTA